MAVAAAPLSAAAPMTAARPMSAPVQQPAAAAATLSSGGGQMVISPITGLPIPAELLPKVKTDEEEIKRKEKQEQQEAFADLGFSQKVGYSMALTWDYKVNIALGCFLPVLLTFLASFGAEKTAGDLMATGLVASLITFAFNLAAYVFYLGFANLILRTIENGDEGVSDLLLEPLSHLGVVLPTLGMWVAIQTLLQEFCLLLAEKGTGGALAGLIIMCLLAPANFCILFFMSKNYDLGPFEILMEALKLFFSNIGQWVLAMLVCFAVACISVFAMFTLWVVVPNFMLVLIGLKILLTIGIAIFTYGMVLTYSGYTYAQIEARSVLGDREVW